MEFCNNCNNLLLVRQYIEKETEEKQLTYYCNQCDFKKKCEENCIYKKIYKQDIAINNQKLLNHNQIHNKTLPFTKIKCPNCKKINNNSYTISYINNSFKINLICKKCCHSWTKK